MQNEWQPQPQLLQEVISLLQAYLVPNNDIQKQSYLQLQQFQQNLEFNLYLVHLFCTSNVDVNVRQVAGLLLKKNIKASNVGQGGKPPSEVEMLAYIRAKSLQVVTDTTHAIRATAGSIVTTFVSQYTFIDEWPELMPTLFTYLDQQQDQNAIAGAFGALCKICEDSASKLENSPSHPLNILIPKLLQYFQHPHAAYRRDALDCINNVLIYMPLSIITEMNTFLQGISQLTMDTNPEIRKLVCKSIVILLETGIQYLIPFLDNIIQFILRASQDPDENVAIEAIEFWAAFCEVPQFDDMKNALSSYLPQIVPLLFDRMVYGEEDLATFEAEEQSQNENVPDRPEDIKPIFHHKSTGTSHGSPETNEEEEEEDDDEEDDDSLLQWNLRRCAAASLDNLAGGYGNEILQSLLPLLQDRLARQEPWPLVESGILALGAIADGCYTGITPHLPQLFPFLLQKLEDPAPLIRSITCWTLSRYASWVIEQGDHTLYMAPLVEGLLKRVLDPHKKVQEAACSAFCTLEEEAREELVPYLTPILQNLMFAFSKYQAKNLLILYDAIGTLADSVGENLNNGACISILMPPLIAKWNSLTDKNREILPLFECLASVAQALANGFQEFAMTVYMRSMQIIQNELLSDALYEQNPTECEEGDPEFIVCALDLISGMLEGLRTNSPGLVAESNILNVLMSCLKHEVLDVRQSAMGVVGDLAKYAPQMLLPGLQEILPVLIQNIDPDMPTVCNNASWSVGEIAVQIGAEIEPYVDTALRPLIAMMNRPRLPRNLSENCAITIGRLGMVCPTLVAPYLQEFAKRWCRGITDVRTVEEKEHCFLGLCYMVKVNPNGIVADFMYMCAAIASLDGIKMENQELKDMIVQIIHGFKTSLGDNWSKYLASFPKELREFMITRFQV